jgi:hypothetical protein
MSPFLIPILGTVAEKVATQLIDKLVKDPGVSITKAEAPAAVEQIAKQLQPVIENLTNNEPVWQSRVVWGSVATILSGASAIIMLIANGDMNLERYVTPVMGLAGGVYALYGRLVVKKPIGA